MADAIEPGLVVSGNRILHQDGSVFRGRGVNLHDTRSCNACVTLPPDPAGLMALGDELTDHWRVTFVRFLLSSWASDDGYRKQVRSIVDDAGYARDVRDVVRHLTDKGVYVLVTVFADPSVTPDDTSEESEWPTEGTLPVYRLLAEMFADDPRVLFGLGNEPHGPPARNADLAERYLRSIDAIREVETRLRVPPHVVVVPAPQNYARDVSYFVDHPLPRLQVAYDIHPYDHAEVFPASIERPARVLPLIVGEYGPTKQMNERDVEALWLLLERLSLPHTAWNFHQRCPPNLLMDDAGSSGDGCGLAAAREGKRPRRTPWGEQVFTYFVGAADRDAARSRTSH